MAIELIVAIVHVMRTRQCRYEDLVDDYCDERERAAVERHSVKGEEKLGYHVALEVANSAP